MSGISGNYTCNKSTQPLAPLVAPIPVTSADAQVTPPVQFVRGVHLTESMHQRTLALLSKANEMANIYLEKNRESFHSSEKKATTSSSVHISYNHWNLFNRETHVHHYHGNNQQKKDDTAERVLIGVIGAVILGVTAFFLGKTQAKSEKDQENLLEYKELKYDWNHNKYHYQVDYQLLVEHVVSRSDLMLHRKETDKTHKIALLILGAVAGATALTGALIGIEVLMLAGLGIAAIVGIGALYKLGYACFSQRDQRDARWIERSLSEISYLPQPAVM